MHFVQTEVPGAELVELEPFRDHRGSLAVAFDADAFARHGLMDRVRRVNVTRSERAGTVRGIHLQRQPHAEAKLVRCTRGAMFDVVVDLRVDSPTYGRWTGRELTPANGHALYVPPGCGHAFQSLEDGTETLYLVDAPYVPEAESGVRFDDPMLDIRWPLAVTALSEKDASWPPLAVV